ncbi:hypothetical protein J2S46_000154 [Kitasatospora herbaricolor]|uniref:hypothetical protein n=1 Tax=Kitasatospora herbaricolor TaxID=68217 RepID=UPI00174E3FD6|nr:hypothetical protein [Kitasatospora herbaricolor]MDQ0305598.1 hypothetical protein [Kitasatospora herbaricolor]
MDEEGRYVQRVFTDGQPRKPCHVYVVVHDGLGAAKYGLGETGPHDIRVRDHLREGWREHDRKLFGDRSAAGAVEDYVRWSLRARGVRAFLSAEQMPQKGASETVALAEMSAEQLWELVEEAATVVKVEYVVRQG